MILKFFIRHVVMKSSQIYLDATLNLVSSNFTFTLRKKVTSAITKRMYDCAKPPQAVYLNCHSPVIYLITCCRCSFQYVGKALTKLKKSN